MSDQALPVDVLADNTAGGTIQQEASAFPADLTLRFEFEGRDDAGSPSGATLYVFAGPRLRNYWPEDDWAEGAIAVPIVLNKAGLEGRVRDCTDVWWKEVVEATSFIGATRYYTYHVQTQLEPGAAFENGLLRRLARAGESLFVQLFGTGGPAYKRTIRFGEALRSALLAEQELRIVVRSNAFFAPWNFLYLGDDPRRPRADHFLGARHVVEHDVCETPAEGDAMPLPERVAVQLDRNMDRLEPTAEHLAVRDFDSLLTQYRLVPVPRNTKTEFLDALRDGVEESLFYFLCHGTAGADVRANADDTKLFLTAEDGPERDGISPSDIDAGLYRSGPLKGRPLVFLNSCRALKSGSIYYSGFAPSFLNQEARAVIGPEIEMPIKFAKEFSRRFFEEFFRGGKEYSIGRVLLNVRRDFLVKHANPLGLAYSLYRGANHYLPVGVLSQAAHSP